MAGVIPMAPVGGAINPRLPNPPTPAPAPMGAGAPPDAGAKPMPKEPKYDAEKVPQPNAGYMGPDKGPFKCGNCEFFDPTDSDCHIVAGKVDAEGCCNMFTKIGDLGGVHQEPDEDDEDSGSSPDDESAGSEEEAPVSINAGK